VKIFENQNNTWMIKHLFALSVWLKILAHLPGRQSLPLLSCPMIYFLFYIRKQSSLCQLNSIKLLYLYVCFWVILRIHKSFFLTFQTIYNLQY